MTMQLSVGERQFLQFMMSRKCCASRDVWKIYRKCSGVNDELVALSQDEANGLVNLVKKINRCISKTGMEIKKCTSEDNGLQYFALINTSDDAISKMASDYKVAELEYFKKIVVAIVENENGAESQIHLLNLTNDIQHKVTKSQAQDFLERLIKELWLVKIDGKYSLSPRSIVELEPYLKRIFPDDIKNCSLCKTIIIKGEACENCLCKIHYHCARQYFVVKNRKVCPNDECQKIWPQYNQAGTEVQSQPDTSQGEASRKRPKTRSRN